MTESDLNRELSHDFDIVTFVDLADAWHKHRSIFDIFKSVRRDSFDDNQRLVLYSSFDLEQEFLDHIQRAAARIDISNFFILIVCPYDITDKLIRANKKFGYDDTSIQSCIRPLEKTKPLGVPGFYSTEHLCPLPFLQTNVSTNGHVMPCCKFQGTTGRLSESSLTDVFFNEKTENIRTLMLQGKKPKECSVCWKNEAAGTTSFRQLAMYKYKDQIDQGWLDDPQLRNLNWSQRSLCNFTCRICDEISSSSIAVEKIRFSSDPKEKARIRALIKESNDSDLNETIIRSLQDLDHLETLHILGGEPLLNPDFFATIDRLIESGLSQKISLEVSTNCSVYPEDYLIKIVNDFRSAEILLSVDNVGEKFEIERGGRWDDVFENMRRFASLKSDRVKVQLAVSINIQNVLDLDDLARLAQELGIEILWWYVEDPDFMCIDRATDRTKELVAARYANHPIPELQKIAARVQSSLGSDGSEFIAHCKTLDQRRGQSFYGTHREIFTAMGGELDDKCGD